MTNDKRRTSSFIITTLASTARVRPSSAFSVTCAARVFAFALSLCSCSFVNSATASCLRRWVCLISVADFAPQPFFKRMLLSQFPDWSVHGARTKTRAKAGSLCRRLSLGSHGALQLCRHAWSSLVKQSLSLRERSPFVYLQLVSFHFLEALNSSKYQIRRVFKRVCSSPNLRIRVRFVVTCTRI